MEEELFLTINDYVNSNRESLKEDLIKYFNSNSYKMNYDEFLNYFPQILFGLYQFINKNDFAKALRERIKDRKKEDIPSLLVYFYFHGAIPVTLSFEKGQKDFYRKYLIPIRYNLSDIMYYGIASLRSMAKDDIFIESKEYSFVSYRYYEDMDYTFLASDYQAYAIYELNDPKMVYGNDELWIFLIDLSYVRLLDDNKALMQGILTDAKGYGIFEGNLDAVINTIFNPMYADIDKIESSKLGVDFENVEFDLLKEETNDGFESIRYYYEANVKE